MTTIDKLIFLIINRFMANSTALSIEDFSLLFEENPSLKFHLCENYIEMPILDNKGQNALLVMPAINVLLITLRNKSLLDYFFTELKDTIQPFKEVYYIEGEQKSLVHGLDLFSIAGRYITGLRDNLLQYVDEIKLKQSLNLRSVNQYFSCIHNHKYLLQSYNFDTHANFDAGFELLFIKNWDYKYDYSDTRNIKFNSVKNLHVPLYTSIDIEIRSIQQSNHEEMKKCRDLILHNILNGRKNFIWSEENVSTLLASNDNIIDQSNEILFKLLQNVANEGLSINKSILSLLFVKNKKVFNEFMQFLKDNQIMIYEDNEIMNEDKKDQFSLELDNIKEIINQYEKTDIKIVEICSEILKNLELLNSEKALAYFTEDVESKFNLESIVYKYIPNILETYFNLPEKIRNDSNRDFLVITLEQLGKINDKLKHIEYDILEREMKKMKIFGSFLDNRFNS